MEICYVNIDGKKGSALPRAGCGKLADEQVEAFCEALTDIEEEQGMHPLFTEGMLAAFSFVTCPEGEEMHGATLAEFAENAWDKARTLFIIDAVREEILGGAL